MDDVRALLHVRYTHDYATKKASRELRVCILDCCVESRSKLRLSIRVKHLT